MQLTHSFSSFLPQLRAFKTTGLSSRHIVVRYPKEVLTFCVYQPLANNPVDCMPVESYPFPLICIQCVSDDNAGVHSDGKTV